MRHQGQQQQHLSAYELERQQKIAANKAKMIEMGVAEARDTLLATQHAERQAKAANRTKPQRKAKPAAPKRRSERNAGRERPDYRGQQELAVYVEKQPRLRLPARDSKSGRVRDVNSRYPSWHMGIPDAPAEAITAALEAAEEQAETLKKGGTPAFVKVMHPSMVAGGGWLQAPPGIERHYAPGDITFTSPDTTRPTSDFRYTQSHRSEGDGLEDAWTVGFLQKTDKKTGVAKGGYGFSKNWKGFAADQFLHPGDSVVFQVTGPAEAVIHIFRAWDYAAERSKPQGFEAVRFSRATMVATSGDDAAEDALQRGGKAAAAAGDDEEDEEEQEEEGAGSAAEEDSNKQADTDAADQQTKKAAAKRSSSSGTKASSSKQQAAAAAAPAGASKAGKRKQANAAAGTDSSSKRQRQSTGGSSRSTKRQRKEPAKASTAAGDRNGKQQQQQQQAKQQKPKKSQQQQQDLEAEAEEEFVVDWILGTKVIGGVRVFKVRWLGYGAEYDTWEPADMFDRNALSYDWGKLQANGNIKRIDPPKTLAL